MESFSFAGFQWPRKVARMACGARALREKKEARRHCGEYVHAPAPNNSSGRGFYLDDSGQPFTRWQWADEISGAGIRHNGWYSDQYQDQTIRGIVAMLPHGRFLAGYAMGEHMAAAIDADIYSDIVDAARMADECARIAAEREMEYQLQMAADAEMAD